MKKSIWSPYAVGSMIGGLLAALFAVGQRFGTSTGIAKVSALFSLSDQEAPHFREVLKDHYIFDWTLVFVVGIFLGSWVASRLSGKQETPRDTIWQANFGPSKIKRAVFALIGGALLMFGARMADGCTSGHAITGGAQFSIASFVFMIAMFAVAIPTSLMLYRKR